MIENYIESLKKVQNPTLTSEYDLKSWKIKAINIVNRIYEGDTKQESQINEIEYKIYPRISFGNEHQIGGGNNLKECEKQAKEIITSFIYDLETFGIPKPKTKKNRNGLNFSFTQNQTAKQNQTVDVNVILELVRDELKESQLKEIKKIINDDDDEPQSKKKRIFDKVKSFGEDVAYKIITSILTNPSLYSG